MTGGRSVTAVLSSTGVLTPVISPSACLKAEGRALCCCPGDVEHTEHGPQRAEDSCLTAWSRGQQWEPLP